MQIDNRKQLILRAIPERKKPSKKLKEKVLEQIYFRSSSLPQKKYTQPKEKDNSFTRRHQDLRHQFSQPSNKQRVSSQVKSSFEKIDQQQQFIPHKPIQRKNHSLPKHLYSQADSSNTDSQFQLQSFKNTDNYRTKAKKLSQKDQKQMLHQSQQKHRLQTLQEILKKKNSQRLIRDNLLSTNMRNSPMEVSHPQKPKNKQSKMIGLKYAFENRKFTNLSKYKTSMGARQNPLGSGKIQYDRDSNNNPSRKVSKQNSKTVIKTSEHDNVCEQDDGKEVEVRKIEAEVKDLDLREYIDGENVTRKVHGEKVITLEDVFGEAYQFYLTGVGADDKPKAQANNNRQQKDKNLDRSLKLLKSIQKQTGSLSRKTVLLLGLVSYHCQEYNNCIFYLQNVFREVNYNLSVIDSMKSWIRPDDWLKLCSDFFIVLAESYKRTENFLCSIKVLDQWERNVARATLKKLSDHHTIDPEKNKKRTISHLTNYETFKNERKLTRNDNHKRQDESITFQNELHLKKKSYSFLRQSSESRMPAGYFSTTVKGKERPQTLAKKQSVKYQTQQLNIKPRSKNLSIKTLSDINLNLDKQADPQIVDEEELKNLPQKQGQVLAHGYLMRARIQFEIKNFYASIQDYQRTLACNQDKLQPGLELATLYYKIGRKEKCIQFLQDFLKQVASSSNLKPRQKESVKQIKYHLAVMLYKCMKFNDSLRVLQSIHKEYKEGLEGQITFYKALNMIKIKRVYSTESQPLKNTKSSKTPFQQSSKTVEEILIMLQQSIDMGSSQFYIYAAYFLRIYLLLFKVKHYYGAQYEIDRMKETIERKKYGLGGQQGEKERVDYGKISIEPFSSMVNLQDLIQLTSGIICILKLKLETGLCLISQIEDKVKASRKWMQGANVISIETVTLSDINQEEHGCLVDQMLKLMYEFKYYALFTMRQYQAAVKCLEKIRLIDMTVLQYGKTQQLRLRQSQSLSAEDDELLSTYEAFTSQSDKLNYLNLQALILIEEKKFHQALKMLKRVEHESRPEDQKRHKRTKSGNLQTISTVIEYKKDENMFHIIKALCYILLYQYLEEQKQSSSRNDQKSLKKSKQQNGKCKQMQQIKITQVQTINHGSSQEQRSESSVQQNNQQILLVAEDLLSQCLVCDKENFEILYLIGVIHYELQRYESALNYIRQAIELSDDHMIKHYYLKANMKLLLGKYEQAVKDYSNAITVYKEFQKQKNELSKQANSTTDHHNHSYHLSPDSLTQNPSHYSINHPESPSMTARTSLSKHQLNQYYEEQQEMHLEVYLNRAVAYLKYAYSVQFQTCRSVKYRAEDEGFVKYQDVRENIANLKSTAAQDVVHFFNAFITKLKLQYNSITRTAKKTLSPQSHHQSSQKQTSSPLKTTEFTPQQNRSLQPLIQKATKVAPYIQLLLHTSDVEPMLEISRTFAKEFNMKLISDEELLVYFYIAKELNNCLLLMEKIIKKHYLSEKNKRQAKHATNSKLNQSRKLATSKYEAQEYEPYFKSKKDGKISKTHHYPEFNAQKYTPKNIHFEDKNEISSEISSPEKHNQEQQKVQKLTFDKKVLSALKDSSSNSREDYENALVSLLQEEELIRKKCSGPKADFQGGSIFTYPDLLFFIGVLYYLLQDFETAARHFTESYSLKKQRNQLYTLKAIASTSLTPCQDSPSQQGKWYNEKLQLSQLKSYEQIYDNRIYSKEEIEYNIGVAFLMAQDYNSAYEYLEKHEQFVEILEILLTQNQSNLDDKKTKNKLKKIKTNFQDSQPEQDPDLSFDQLSVKTKTNKSDQDSSDITPFPTHNRLCSIYPQKTLNGKNFFLSFCLPKIQLPLIALFYPQEIQIANLFPTFKEDSQNPTQSFIINDTKELFINRSPPKLSSHPNPHNFALPKSSIINFLDIVTLKDIEMKPIAPWIKKDKQKKCIRFTDNFLAESYDLKTQTTTERKHRNSSKKDMFAENSSKAFRKKNADKQQITSQRQQFQEQFQKINKEKVKNIKKSRGDEYNFMKQKQKQKTGQNRYDTIEHE